MSSSHLTLTSLAFMMTSLACMSSSHLTPHTWRGLETRPSMRQPHAAPRSSRLGLVCRMRMLAPHLTPPLTSHLTPPLPSHLTPQTCGVVLTWRASGSEASRYLANRRDLVQTTLRRRRRRLLAAPDVPSRSLSRSLSLSLGCSLLLTQLGKEAAHLLSLLTTSLCQRFSARHPVPIPPSAAPRPRRCPPHPRACCLHCRCARTSGPPRLQS